MLTAIEHTVQAIKAVVQTAPIGMKLDVPKNALIFAVYVLHDPLFQPTHRRPTAWKKARGDLLSTKEIAAHRRQNTGGLAFQLPEKKVIPYWRKVALGFRVG